ncbi:MAG TPA: translocation/assembly module TamB domain-containing protein, partial [Stenomitos sp.]
RTAVRFEAPNGTYPTVGNALVHQGKTFLQNVVAQIKGGPLRLDGVVADGRVNVDATLPGLTLTEYSDELRGTLSGRLAVTGPLAGFGAKTARAQGSVKFSQGLSVLQDPLNAKIRWDGRQILVDRATAPNFLAQGKVGAELEGPQGPSLTTLDLNVLARNYQINRLAAPGLTQNPLYGLAGLNGRLTGTVSAPVLTSQLEVDQLRVSNLEFEPFLVGTFNYDTVQGLALNLGGTRDRIQVALDAQQRPISLDIRRDQSTIIGRRTTPDRFDATFTDVPLLALNSFPQLIPPQLTPNLKPVSGVASGTIAMNLPTWETAGSFTVERPGLGRFLGDRFTGQIRYANGVGTLSEGRLVQGKNQYQLDATLSNFANPQVTGRLLIAQAQVEDLIAVAKSLQLSLGPSAADGTVQGRAQDVGTVPVNMQQVPLWQQLQRLSEVDALLEQVKEKQGGSELIPDWQKLTGTLAGAIQFSGSLQAGVNATFDLQGQNWDLDPYRFDQFIAKGNLSPSGINFEPLTLRYGTSAASFNGRIGGPQQSGQLVLNQFPVETIADLLELPVNLTGQLNGTATLAGRWDNPSVEGQFSLNQGTLNRAAIQQATAQFDYQGARLAFGGEANIGSPEPIRIRGSVPYALPFSAVQPNSREVDIAMSVKDQGLSLVNLFTDQVSWVDGKGDLALQVNGTSDKPILNGALTLQDATLRSPTLADPLTAVNGTVRFDSDRIMVKSLTGRYNQGELSAEGNLPIFNDALRVKEPLVVSLNNTALNVKGLYRGQANGNLSVTGSATSPNLIGFIALQNGEVLLAEATALESANTVPGTADSGNMSVDFQDLQVRLGENVRILQPPILSFVASGQVDLDGTLNAPRPNGVVKFEKGNVYLFTTLFRVDQRQNNYAQFTPAYGLDPYLNLSLRTTVTETAVGRKTNLNEFADIQAGSLGSIESVRVRATLRGRASQLSTRFNDVLELSSTPSRTPTEILALLSGGVSQSLASGDTQGALVNLAGSAFFNRVQSVVDDVLGSRATFRLFPLLTPTEDKSSTVLELGAEFGYDVTDRLSLSLLQVVTSPNELPQFNVSYDITDQLRARGSVNFQGDAVGILEYRLRF